MDLVHKRCLCKRALPSFGAEGERPTRCAACKTEGMMDVVHRKCMCKRSQPRFGLVGERPTRCAACKTDGMVDVVNTMCENGCGTRAKSTPYKGYCLRCFVYLHPGEKVSRNYRVKEQHFTDHIKAAGILPNHSQVTFDKRLQGGCSGRKPDIFVDMYTHTVHCENDEDQHRNYTCENKRLMELFRDAGNRPQVQLRFNPDGFTAENGVRHPSCFKYNKYGVPVIRDQTTWDRRMGAYMERLRYHLTHVPDREITVEHICYNGYKWKSDERGDQVGQKRKRMAPASRPILAVSETGTMTRYHSKRAASEATGIPAASVAFAASNLALRDGRLWKFEDDPRQVDMSRCQAVREQVVAAPTEADVEQARDFVDALRGDDGRMITEMRLSDGYVSATKMCQSAGKMWGHYNAVEGNVAFRTALATSLHTPIADLVQSITNGPLYQRGTWVHPQLAIHLASWCSPTFAVKVTALVLRYLTGQVTTEESRAAAKTVAERAVPPEETDEDSRALKRLKVTHEIELEKTKHANEMAKHANEMANHANELAKLQSETSRLRMESTRELMEGSKRLIDGLASGIAPPALTGMINIARHNLAVKCLAVLGPSGPASDPGIEPPVAPRLVAAARRVTVQEFGRDILGLRADQLATARLSVVGSKLGRMWKSQPGKGEIVELVSNSGEKSWKRTVAENGAPHTSTFSGPLDATMLANNRIKFSAAYLGTNEIGNGQAYDVWTYQLNEVENLMREAFRA
ncbi:hypothetical protein KFL_003890100 [Klebsormidium nitens]|uniref:KilA-N domain-containing protein n=1 Tax=Klebsormidium nitens TaxID=105231 RepID=A0A1Y1IES2_KLENI|nr:hypothetical protein KFL_003890100 [Klebsormidium nitens]|eukprot:GAQ87939.1 hypothetical protein KFL_003890100 [Klebsormidium nitens]